MENNRIVAIDIIRGIAIFAMILIHCTYYFRSDPLAQFLWNYSQFAVPVFIFCSFYLYFQKDHLKFVSLESKEFFPNYLSYLKKRFSRLLKPYYLFILFFFILLYSINPMILDSKFIIQSLVLVGGVDVNWLILLFLQLTFLLPFISYFLHKQKYLAHAFFTLATLSTLFLLLYPTPFALNHKFISWLPWSSMVVFAYIFTKLAQKKSSHYMLLAFFGIVLLSTSGVVLATSQPFLLRDHKYPPDLYFLSYGIVSIIFLYLISPYLGMLKKPFIYLSTYSYQIYFIHYFFLIWFASYKSLLSLPWWIFFGMVITPTLLTLWCINKFAYVKKS